MTYISCKDLSFHKILFTWIIKSGGGVPVVFSDSVQDINVILISNKSEDRDAMKTDMLLVFMELTVLWAIDKKIDDKETVC